MFSTVALYSSCSVVALCVALMLMLLSPLLGVLDLNVFQRKYNSNSEVKSKTLNMMATTPEVQKYIFNHFLAATCNSHSSNYLSIFKLKA